MGGESLKPSARCLFQAVERLPEKTDGVRLRGVDETRRLLAEHLLRQMTVEEHILDVKLMNRPVTRERKREHCANGGWLDDRAESFIKINTFTLRESSQDPPCLVPIKRTIGLQLVTENPLACDNVSIARWINEVPSVVGQKSTILLNHEGVPIRIL